MLELGDDVNPSSFVGRKGNLWLILNLNVNTNRNTVLNANDPFDLNQNSQIFAVGASTQLAVRLSYNMLRW